MLTTAIHHVHQFTQAQSSHYVQQTHCVSLNCAGIKHFSVDGHSPEQLHNVLIFSPAHSHIQLEALNNRENWVISFSCENIRIDNTDNNQRFELRFQDEWISLPRVVPIPHEHLSGWRGEFMRMRDSFLNPLPIDQFRVHLGLMNIWRYFVTGEPDRYTLSAAKRLKNLIDNDHTCAQSIAQLSSNLGYSTDHLRILFKKEYAMAPASYRNQRRMAKALDLIANSDMKIQAIAQECGFQQSSHFSAHFRKNFKLSPREALRKFRTL